MEEVRTVKPYEKAFAWGGIWLIISTILLSVIYQNFSAAGFGRMFALAMISSAVVGFQAKRSKSTWSFRKVGLIYFFVAVVVFLVSSCGAIKRAD